MVRLQTLGHKADMACESLRSCMRPKGLPHGPSHFWWPLYLFWLHFRCILVFEYHPSTLSLCIFCNKRLACLFVADWCLCLRVYTGALAKHAGTPCAVLLCTCMAMTRNKLDMACGVTRAPLLLCGILAADYC